MRKIQSKHLLAATLLLTATTAMAQGLNSAYYTENYNFRHDLNPAYGNDDSYVSIPALGNITVSTHGNFGYQDIVYDNPRYGQSGQKKMTTFMNPYISVDQALSGFNTGNNRVSGDVSIAILSAGFKAFGGYNTIELNSKTNFGVALPYELFELAKNTGNKTYDIGDVNAHAQSYAELAFGHSRQINDKLRVGAKVKLLFGLGRADVEMKNVKADLSGTDQWKVTADAEANVSVKGFEYISEQEQYDSREGTYEHINDVDVDGTGLNGFGMALDLGAVYKINQDWTVNAAVLDLGFLSWSENHRATIASNEFTFNGFHDFDVKGGEGKETFDDKWDYYKDQLADFANLKDTGEKSSRTTGIGATINVGATYNLPVYRKMTFGVLSSTRLNGAYTWTEGRLSANWEPLNWLDGGVSLAVNSFTTSMGWVINVHPKGFTFHIGMDHLLGKTSKEFIPLSSNASFNVGMSVTW